MFCPNCGNNCENANFCPKCGTKLPQQAQNESAVWQIGMPCPHCGGTKLNGNCCAFCGAQLMADSEESGDKSSADFAAMPALDEIPEGLYMGVLGYIELHKTDLEFYTGSKVFTIPYNQLYAVCYRRKRSYSNGTIVLRWQDNKEVPLPEFGREAWDRSMVSARQGESLFFYHLSWFLYTFTTPTSVPAPRYTPGEMPEAAPSNADLSKYYEEFNPYREEAAQALSIYEDITLSAARQQIDHYFDLRQREEYAAEPQNALRDLVKMLNTPSDRKRKELEMQGKAFCPKCLSEDITAKRRGFSYTRGALGNRLAPGLGILVGSIGADTTECICLKCGHEWLPRKE